MPRDADFREALHARDYARVGLSGEARTIEGATNEEKVVAVASLVYYLEVTKNTAALSDHGAWKVNRVIWKEMQAMNSSDAKSLKTAALRTPTNLTADAARDISGALTALLADLFALYIKTKNFHWHVSGPHFRDYHLLLDEQGEQIFATTDAIAERVRKIGGTTLRSIGHIGRLQRVLDNDAYYVTPMDMLAELRDDNNQLTAHMREAHSLCDEHNDVASASLLENWIDEAERRVWFLFEASRTGDR